MSSILDTPEFRSLVRRAWLAPVRKADVDTSDLPEGFSLEEAWDALCAVRHAQSFRSPSALRSSIESRDGWHTVPVSLQRTLDEIASLTHKGSPLDLLAHERKGRSFITQQYVEEMVCNLSFDGWSVEYEDLRAVILGERAPMRAAERIALNFHQTMYGLDALEEAPFDRAILEKLYDRLVEGVDEPLAEADFLPRSPLFEHYASEAGESLPEGGRTRNPGREGGGGQSAPDAEAPRFERGGFPKTSLQLPIDVAKGCASDPPRYPIMNSMLVNCQFWRAAIFPSCNNLMGCVASRLYLVQQGYPVFRYVPKIRILEKWRLGEYGPEAALSFDEAISLAEESGDWTFYYDAVMRLMLREVRAVARSLSVKARVDEGALAGISRIPNLSHRQREVLRRAVLVPDKDFRIASHQEKYGIAYSTARADLEKLADMGLLSRFVDGQAHSYRAVAYLRGALASR